MEVVLQWLDDVEDLVFAAAFLWRGLRRLCLGLGMLAALAVGASISWLDTAALATAFAVVALLSVSAWILVLFGYLVLAVDRKISQLQS